LPLIVHEDEIQQMRRDAELHVAGLESLHDARLSVEASADGRPAAQLALGRLLHVANEMLERPAFGDAEQADFAKTLLDIKAWKSSELSVATYQKAFVSACWAECPDAPRRWGCHRRQDSRRVAVAAPVCDRSHNQRLGSVRGSEEVGREHGETRAVGVNADVRGPDLAAACTAGKTLDELFHFVDESLWATLKTDAAKLTIERDLAHECTESYESEWLHPRPTLNIPPGRIKYHPFGFSGESRLQMETCV
jgi:hypothetical protein